MVCTKYGCYLTNCAKRDDGGNGAREGFFFTILERVAPDVVFISFFFFLNKPAESAVSSMEHTAPPQPPWTMVSLTLPSGNAYTRGAVGGGRCFLRRRMYNNNNNHNHRRLIVVYVHTHVRT